MDSTFEFEKQRHVPVKYSRELWEKSVQAIKRVEEIKEKRQAQFIKNRLKAGLKLHREADKREVQQSVHLLQDPEATGMKVRAAQKERRARRSKAKVAEMETEG